MKKVFRDRFPLSKLLVFAHHQKIWPPSNSFIIFECILELRHPKVKVGFLFRIFWKKNFEDKCFALPLSKVFLWFKRNITLIFFSFSDVFCWFQPWNDWKRFKINKKVENGWKKVVSPTFRCFKHLKVGQNTKHSRINLLKT